MYPPYYNSQSVKIKDTVDDCIGAFEQHDIALLQNKLYELVGSFNKPKSGQLITGFPEKNRLGECFCLCLMYDWMNDSEVREVWAENGFYCTADYLLSHLYSKRDLIAASLNMFNILIYGENDLRTKFEDILTKGAIEGNPVFSQNNYAGGYAHLIRELKFFVATLLSPLVSKYPLLISEDNRQAFDVAKTDFEFATVPVEKILSKIQFISRIIASILNEMFIYMTKI